MWIARASRGKGRAAGSRSKIAKMGIHVPKDLHRRFRARLILEGRLMQEVIREWVDEEVSSHRNRPPAQGGLRFFKGVDRNTLAALAVPIDLDKIRRLKSKLLMEGRNISQWGTERMEQFLRERT
ncbi:MAG TPA: hypothetical protein VFP86_11210 [bacterium]|nr:hypothetical protein [bacterium]